MRARPKLTCSVRVRLAREDWARLLSVASRDRRSPAEMARLLLLDALSAAESADPPVRVLRPPRAS
jgi:hypothetical protein